MFIGHFAVAFLLIYIFPGVSPFIPLVGVSFPDLLWPFLIWAGIEKVSISPDSPYQKDIVFKYYPFSHSLVLGTGIAVVLGVIIGLLVSPLSGFVFVLASASHWFLDAIVHLKDLPILGFNNDKKVGFGLWKRGWTSFIGEYVFYAIIVLLVVPGSMVVGALILGAVFHLLNLNSFVGFTRKNPFKGSSAVYALITLIGFSLFILFAEGIN